MGWCFIDIKFDFNRLYCWYAEGLHHVFESWTVSYWKWGDAKHSRKLISVWFFPIIFFKKFIPIKKLKTLVKMMFRLINPFASQFSGRHLSISYKINLLSCLAKSVGLSILKRRKDSNVWCLFKLSWRKKKNMRKIWYEKGLKMVFCLRKLRRKQKTTTKQSFPNMLAKWISGT